MDRVYQVPFKKDLLYAQIGNGAQISGIAIDNPSGYWLRVEGIEQYVPPFTIGWAYPVSPAQASASVRFVSVSPAGSLSAEIPATVAVTLSDTALAANAGSLSGTGARQSDVPVLQYAEVTVECQAFGFGAGLPTDCIAAVAGFDIVIVSLGAIWTWGNLDGDVFTIVFESNNQNRVVFTTAISIAMPVSFAQFAPGSVIIPAAEGKLTAAGGSIRQRSFVGANAQYYYQRAA